MSTDELANELGNGAYVLDVRQHEEWLEKHIPGVVLVPLAELAERIEDMPEDRRIWVVCAVGARSLTAAEALIRAGYDAVSVAGGTNKWVEEGRPFESGE